jgi:hypothetical protein
MTLPLVPEPWSPLSLIPASGVVEFTTGGDETWTEPLIGYAIVVTRVT